MSDIQINQLLQQMRSMAAMAENQTSGADSAEAVQMDFAELVRQSIDQVNQTQKASSQLATAFEQGDPNVNLSDVMVAIQKASVSFQAMTQVRNNLVSAYKEVMNMQV